MQNKNSLQNKSYHILAVTIGLLIAIFGLLIILAWKYDIIFLEKFGLGEITAKANTGVFFTLSGIALILLRFTLKLTQILSGFLLVIAALIEFLAILQYVFSVNLGINEIFFLNDFLHHETSMSIKITLIGVICYALIGIVLFFFSIKKPRINFFLQYSIVFSISICILDLLGFLLGFNNFSYTSGYSEMAVITSLLYIPLSIVTYYIFLSKFTYKTSTELKFFVGKIIAILFIVFYSFLFNSILNSKGENNNVLNSHNTSYKFNLILSGIVNIDSGIREFLMSQDENNLIPVETAKKELPRLIQEISVLVTDNKQQARLDTLKQLIHAKIEYAETFRSILLSDGLDAGNKFISKNPEINLTNRIKDTIYKIKAEENIPLNLKIEAENQKIWRLILINLFIQISLLSGIFFLIHKNNLKLAKATNDIKQINDELEKAVINRTVSLTQSQERYRSTIDNMAEGCQLLDFNWRYLYINDAAEKHNRCSKESLMGKIYMDMWPGVESTEVFSKLKTCMNERTIQKMETEFVFPDGSKGWYELRIQPVLEGISILSTDITQRILSENNKKLAIEILNHLNVNTKTEEMAASIIDSIKANTNFDAVGIRIKKDNDLIYLKTYGFSNEFIETDRHLCNFSKDGKIKLSDNGEPLPYCLCGDIINNRIDRTSSFFTKGGSFLCYSVSDLKSNPKFSHYLAVTRNQCNSFNYESVALIPIKLGDLYIGLLQLIDHKKNIFTDDIVSFFEGLGTSIGIALMRNKVENELKLLNDELESRIAERTQKLLESNKELESFAYSVSHDLRAPLRHVIGFSKKLEEYLIQNNDPEVTRLIEKITQSSSKMNKLIDELLTYSRLGKTDLNFQPVSLNKIVKEVINDAEEITDKRKIIWKIDDLPDVTADQTGIKLVYQNLINNAIKFSEKKEKSVIEIGVKHKNEKEYLFYIKDNGVGFNMEYVNKLFGVFQRLHASNEFEGTGIGLASVRRIINRHGGKVWAEGKENEGATFHFTLLKNSKYEFQSKNTLP